MKQDSYKKTVVITGCSTGFGAKMVDTFVQNGWQVLGASRKSADKTSQIPGLEVIEANVATVSGRTAILDYVEKNWAAKVDCLINNAGYVLAGPLETMTENQIRDQMEVNFFAPVLLTQLLLPCLRAAKGRVINISSCFGYTGMTFQGLYCASKFALEGISESLYHELDHVGVQVAIIEPGGFRTDLLNNIVRSSSEHKNSAPYKALFQGFENFFQRLLQNKRAKGPDVVAQCAYTLAQKNKMPLRTRVGADAHILYYLKRILPQNVTNYLFRKQINKLLRA